MLSDRGRRYYALCLFKDIIFCLRYRYAGYKLEDSCTADQFLDRVTFVSPVVNGNSTSLWTAANLGKLEKFVYESSFGWAFTFSYLELLSFWTWPDFVSIPSRLPRTSSLIYTSILAIDLRPSPATRYGPKYYWYTLRVTSHWRN